MARGRLLKHLCQDHCMLATGTLPPHRIDDASGAGVQIVAADLNQDERTDMATASKLGTFVFLKRGR